MINILSLVLKPLSAEAKATLTTKPGQDPNIPQADVSIVVNEVALHVDKLQVSVCCHDAKLCVVMTITCVLRVYAHQTIQ